jgi:4-methyl-5(b-hydroxyethyl)-thiazole monophosphate biosynthesis
MPGTLNLKEDDALKAAVINWVKQGSAYGAICAAPTVLAAWGLLLNKQCTCYPGFESDLGEAQYSEQAVIKDGNCLTSRGVGTAIDYACAWVSYFKDDLSAKDLRQKILAV